MSLQSPQTWQGWGWDPRVAIGWRVWALRDDRLHPISALPYVWEPSGNVARCFTANIGRIPCRPEDVPNESCLCGFWALRSLRQLVTYVEKGLSAIDVGDGLFVSDLGIRHTVYVAGQVALWGTVLACEHGWRASRANVLCLAQNELTRPLAARGFVVAPISEMCDPSD